MKDLKQLVLFRNSGTVIEEFLTGNDKKLSEGRSALINALGKSDYDAEVFKQQEFPNYALSAFQHEAISEAQFTSLMLLWSATADYPDEHMDKFKVHHLSADDFKTRKRFEQYLNLQSIAVPQFLKSRQFNDSLSAKTLDAIFKKLTSDEIPLSERTFFTFEISKNEESAKMFLSLAQLQFKFFIPIHKANGRLKVIVPSFTMIQTAINEVAPNAKTLIPRIGQDDFDDVFSMHVQNQHPFGISFPGAERDIADELKSGRLGFAIHDIYHIILLAFTPHKEIVEQMVLNGKKQHDDCQDSEKAAIEQAVNAIIDNEFRLFTSGNVLSQLRNDSQYSEVLKSPEMNVVAALMSILVKAVAAGIVLNSIQAHDKQAGIDANVLKKMQQEADESQLKIKTDFIKNLLEGFFTNPEKWQALGIHLGKLINLLQSDMVNEIVSDGLKSSYDPNVQLQQIAAQEVSKRIQSITKELTISTTHSSWLSYYQSMSNDLQCFVRENNSKEMNKLLLLKEFPEYITDINNITLDSQPLLQHAVNHQNTEVAEALIKAGAKVKDSYLFSATQNKDSAMVSMLLKNGANPYTLNDEKHSAIDYCLQNGDVSTLKVLLQKVSLSEHHLAYLSRKGISIHPQCQELLKRYKLFKDRLYDIYHTCDIQENLNKLEELIATNSDHFSYATEIEFKQCDKVKVDEKYDYPKPNAHMYRNFLYWIKIPEQWALLTQHQTLDIDKRDEEGNTLLHLLLKESDNDKIEESVDKVIALGANLNAVNDEGESVLMLALKQGHVSIAKALIDKGAVPDIKLNHMSYMSILFELIGNNQWNEQTNFLFQFLVEHGFDLNKKQLIEVKKGLIDLNPEIKIATPWSLLRGYPIMQYDVFNLGGAARKIGEINLPLELRIFSIEHGADPNQADHNGHMELVTAINNEWYDYLELLLKFKANPNLTDDLDNSPLHVAARKGDKKAYELLVAHGAKSFANTHGMTPEAMLAKREIGFHANNTMPSKKPEIEAKVGTHYSC